MYGVEPTFWLKLFLLLGFVLVIGYSFDTIMRKWLKLEKPKLFSYNHVNAMHKKIDWSLRGMFVVLIIIGGIVNIARLPDESIVFLETWLLLLVLFVLIEVVRAFMEWKYAKNPKAYIATISQLVFLGIVVSSIFMTDFYGFLLARVIY